jgi:hypothetical protein
MMMRAMISGESEWEQVLAPPTHVRATAVLDQHGRSLGGAEEADGAPDREYEQHDTRHTSGGARSCARPPTPPHHSSTKKQGPTTTTTEEGVTGDGRIIIIVILIPNTTYDCALNVQQQETKKNINPAYLLSFHLYLLV